MFALNFPFYKLALIGIRFEVKEFCFFSINSSVVSQMCKQVFQSVKICVSSKENHHHSLEKREVYIDW